jgi:hypothetical protein
MERWEIAKKALRAVKGNKEFENSESIIKALISKGLISKRQAEKVRLSSLITTLYFDYSGKTTLRSLSKKEREILRNYFKSINKVGVYNVARDSVYGTNILNEEDQDRYEKTLKLWGFDLSNRYTGEYIQDVIEKEILRLQSSKKVSSQEKFKHKFNEASLRGIFVNYAKRSLDNNLPLDIIKIGLDNLIDTAFRKKISKEEKNILINHILREVATSPASR